MFHILLRIAGRFLKNLRMIERDFTRIEKRLYDSLKNEELIQLLGLSKSLVYFSSSLKGNEVTMEKGCADGCSSCMRTIGISWRTR